jgi:hypothetical protein
MATLPVPASAAMFEAFYFDYLNIYDELPLRSVSGSRDRDVVKRVYGVLNMAR